MKHAAAIALLLFGATAMLAAEPMTLDQAVAAALENSANVRNARLEIEKGENRVAAARTQRLPALTFEAIGGEALNRLSFEIEKGELGEFESGPVPNTDTKIELSRTFSMFGIARITQPITQLHAIGLGVKLNEAALAVNKEQERAARLAVTREVKNAYFAVLSAKGYANATEEAVQAWQEVEREMNVRVAEKAALEADRLDATARLASTKLASLSASNALANAQDQLNYLVGREVEVVDATAAIVPIKLEGDAQRRPDIREAELRVEQARLSVRLKQADRIPDVALMVSNATPFGNDRLPRNMTSAGITMSYEPFTWGRRKAELTEKRHAVEQAENALRDARSVAEIEIAVHRRKTEEAAAQIAVRRLETEAARERLRVTQTKFHEQAARPDEMFSASASLTQAGAREQEAISAYWSARAAYEQAIGQE